MRHLNSIFVSLGVREHARSAYQRESDEEDVEADSLGWIWS